MILLLLLACGAPPEVRTGAGPAVSVLTYNVNFERFDPATIDAIAAADADLVFLQETTAEWEQAIRSRLGDRYPTMRFDAHEPDGGSAVLSRGPVEVHARLDSPVGAFPAHCLVAQSALGPLRVLHVHLHPPLDEWGLISGYLTTGGKRHAEVEAHLGCFDAPPDLAVGDFNEETGQAVALLEAAGLRDAASAFPPPARTWSWQSDYGELTGRPDHVFYGAELTPERVEVLEGGASDHRPLRVALQRAAP